MVEQASQIEDRTRDMETRLLCLNEELNPLQQSITEAEQERQVFLETLVRKSKWWE